MNAVGMMQDFFKELFEQAKAILLPPKTYFAWQTLLLLSLFSVIVAAILDALDKTDNTPLSVQVLSTLSWIFLTSAIWWALSKDQNPIKVAGFSISPWITGAVLCIFLFQPRTPTRLRWALSCWPMISTAIKALPYFVGWELQPKKVKDKDLQELVVTTLVTLLITSWILFHFRVQDWVSNYPSLLVSGLDRSSFVYDFDQGDRDTRTQGVRLLEGSADAIEEDLDDLPWYQTERWLVNRQEQMERVSGSALRTLDAPTEKIFWRLILPVPRRLGEGYLITLRANWLGPVAKDDGFYLEKSCRIMPKDAVRQIPVEQDKPLPTSKLTEVTCEEIIPAVKWIKPGGVNG